MKDLTTFLYNNIKPVIDKGENIHGLYSYLEMIGDPTRFTSSVYILNTFGASYFTNNDILSLQKVIESIYV